MVAEKRGGRRDAVHLRLARERGSAGALPLGDAVDQSCSPALADIIGARRVRMVAMISSGSIPWR
jgi:hypothetical protein